MQRMKIHNLKDDIKELKKIMVLPRLHLKYMEDSRNYKKKKEEGEYVTQRERDMYDLSSNRSTPIRKQHKSMCKDLNDKSRISLPVLSNNAAELNNSQDEFDGDQSLFLNKFDFIPGQLFNPITDLERHNELVGELRGSRNKPSILGQYKSVASFTDKKMSLSKVGNITDRGSKAKLSFLERNLAASTDFSEESSKLSMNKIFDKHQKMIFPKTMKQKELLNKKTRHNQSLPQLIKAPNDDISSVTRKKK